MVLGINHPCFNEFPEGPPGSIAIKCVEKLLVRKCCCCISLKVYCIILGLLQLILALPFLIIALLLIIKGTIHGMILLIGIVLIMKHCGELVYAIFKSRKDMVVQFLRVQLVVFVYTCAIWFGILLLVLMALILSDKVFFTIMTIVIGISSTLVLFVGYNTVVVYSHHKQMEDKDNDDELLVEA